MQPTGPLEGAGLLSFRPPPAGPPHSRVRSRGLQQKLPSGLDAERGASSDPQRSVSPTLPWVRCRAGSGSGHMLVPAWPPSPLPSTPSPPQEGPSAGSRRSLSPVIDFTDKAWCGDNSAGLKQVLQDGGHSARQEHGGEARPPAHHCHGDDRTVKKLVVPARNKPGVGSPRPPGSSRRTRGPGTLVLSAPIHHSGCERAPDERKAQWGRGLVQGSAQPEPVPRTHTDPLRHMSPGACHRLRAGILTGAGRRPLCWADLNPAPRGRVSTDRTRRHEEPPSVRVLGALPTPQLLDAHTT